ncbi:hypothetical protein IWQ60_003549 [Tieghemiomyces parasiticus]|uniref:Non-specific serine/threonine protein kinase n=1 Tax=Tieghemiomyces parasiticus TaxID=78921 RepID=A0A9W8AA52_9FUNG|nr:hypothetical protein IWQ60_003549 [Tieghemiomyces parasiticus]
MAYAARHGANWLPNDRPGGQIHRLGDLQVEEYEADDRYRRHYQAEADYQLPPPRPASHQPDHLPRRHPDVDCYDDHTRRPPAPESARLFSRGFNERLARLRADRQPSPLPPPPAADYYGASRPPTRPAPTHDRPDSWPHPPTSATPYSAPLTGGGPADYQFHQLIGSGAFGRVYLARGLRGPYADHWVAIKRISKSTLTTSEMYTRLTQEIEIHWQIRHPHVVALYDYFEDGRYVYLVLELGAQGELYGYLHRGLRRPLTEAEARGVLYPLVHAVKYLHDRKVIHRDLKLGNILLTEDMKVKLCDFGLATRFDQTTTGGDVLAMGGGGEPRTMCGTPNYIAPEIWARRTYGPPSDMWSLGCLFVSFLLGRAPFGSAAAGHGDNDHDVGRDRHGRETRRFDPATIDDRTLQRLWSELPTDLSDAGFAMVRGLLKLNPDNRLTARQLLHHPFFHPSLPVVSLRFIREVAHSLPERATGSGGSDGNGGMMATAAGHLREPASARDLDAVYQALDRHAAGGGGVPQLHREPPAVSGTPTMTHERLPPPPPQYPRDRREPPVARRAAAGRDAYPATLYDPVTAHGGPTTAPAPPSAPILRTTAQRLNPYRKVTKKFTLEIRKDQRVMAHFYGDPVVLLLNARGTRLYICAKADMTKFLNAPNHPAEGTMPDLRHLAPQAQFATTDVPAQYLPAFTNLCSLIQRIRARTPRIVLGTPQARVELMENEPFGNARVTFHNGIVVAVDTVRRKVEFCVPQKGLPDSIHQFTLPKAARWPPADRTAGSNGEARKGIEGSEATLRRPTSAGRDATDLDDEDDEEGGSTGAGRPPCPTGSADGVGGGDEPLLLGASDLANGDPIGLARIRGEIPELLLPLYRHVVACYRQCLAIHVELGMVETRLGHHPKRDSAATTSSPRYPVGVKIVDMDIVPTDLARIFRRHGLDPDSTTRGSGSGSDTEPTRAALVERERVAAAVEPHTILPRPFPSVHDAVPLPSVPSSRRPLNSHGTSDLPGRTLLPPKTHVPPISSASTSTAPSTLHHGPPVGDFAHPRHHHHHPSVDEIVSQLMVQTGYRTYFIPQVGWCIQSTSTMMAIPPSDPNDHHPKHSVATGWLTTALAAAADAQPTAPVRHFIMFFIDGILLLIDVQEQTVEWVDQSTADETGSRLPVREVYRIDETLPNLVKDRLGYFPVFRKGLDQPNALLL